MSQNERPHIRTKLVLDIPTIKGMIHNYLKANGYHPLTGTFQHERTTSGYRVSGYEVEVQMPLPFPNFPALPAGPAAEVQEAVLVDEGPQE